MIKNLHSTKKHQLGRIFFLGSRKRYALRAAIYSFLSSRARSSWASDFLILSLVSFFISVCFWFRKGTKNPGTITARGYQKHIYLGLTTRVFFRGIETRTSLYPFVRFDDAITVQIWGIIPMAGHLRDRRDGRLQSLDQEQQRLLLLRSPGVLALTIPGQSADVADSDGIAVVAGDVRTDLGQRTAKLDIPVCLHDEMISYLAESPALVPDIDVAGGIILPLDGGRTVDDDVSDLARNRLTAVDIPLCFFPCHNLHYIYTVYVKLHTPSL